MSRASRDSDEKEWGAKWGTDETKGDQHQPAEQPEKKEPPKPAVSDKDRKESFIALPPPSPMEGKQRAKPARPATPKTMKPAPPPVMYPSEAPEKKPAPEPGVSQPSSKFEGEPEIKPPPPKREVVVTPAVSPTSTEPLFLLEALGGVLISRGMKVHPGGGFCFGLNLGKLLGWKGLYTTLDVDVFSTKTNLGSHSSVLYNALLGFRGRFDVWKLRLVIGVGFGVTHMIVVSGSPEREPELGFGAAAVAGVEVPVSQMIAVVIQADGRYMQESETSNFQPSSMIAAGVVFSF